MKITDIKEFKFPAIEKREPRLYRDFTICYEDDLYQLLKLYVVEQSTAKDYISNYMDVMLKHISKRMFEDGYDILDFVSAYYR